SVLPLWVYETSTLLSDPVGDWTRPEHDCLNGDEHCRDRLGSSGGVLCRVGNGRPNQEEPEERGQYADDRIRESAPSKYAPVRERNHGQARCHAARPTSQKPGNDDSKARAHARDYHSLLGGQPIERCHPWILTGEPPVSEYRSTFMRRPK